MKTKILAIFLLTFFTLNTMTAQTTHETEAIEKTITSFAKAADARDEKMLDELLDAEFRLVLNQLFGGRGLVIITKQAYLAKIASKEFGGDNRSVTIESILVSGKNASARAFFKSEKMTIVTLLQLIKTAEGKWKIINDLPSIV